MSLKGFPKIDHHDIMTELKSHNLKPTSCTQIQNDQFSSYPIYKIMFTPETNVLEVRKLGIIFHSCMHWEKYDSKILSNNTYTTKHMDKSNYNKNPNRNLCNRHRISTYFINL